MSNLSVLELREYVANWYENLSNEDKIKLLENYISEMETSKGIFFLDEVLTPIYCEEKKIILE